MNATNLGIENGYPKRIAVVDDYTSWDVSVPDSIQYGTPIVNVSPNFGSTVEKLQRAGLDVAHDKQIVELSRMSNQEVATHYGKDFADKLERLRCPLGRTGLNGVGIFYEAGQSCASDMIAFYEQDGQLWVPLVFNRNRWNTSGGFSELSDKDGTETVLREFHEEVGHQLDTTIVPIINEVKTSDRTTDHGWMKVEVYATKVDSMFELQAADDAEDAKWFPVDDLPTMVANKILSKTKLEYINAAKSTLNL